MLLACIAKYLTYGSIVPIASRDVYVCSPETDRDRRRVEGQSLLKYVPGDSVLGSLASRSL